MTEHSRIIDPWLPRIDLDKLASCAQYDLASDARVAWASLLAAAIEAGATELRYEPWRVAKKKWRCKIGGTEHALDSPGEHSPIDLLRAITNFGAKEGWRTRLATKLRYWAHQLDRDFELRDRRSGFWLECDGCQLYIQVEVDDAPNAGWIGAVLSIEAEEQYDQRCRAELKAALAEVNSSEQDVAARSEPMMVGTAVLPTSFQEANRRLAKGDPDAVAAPWLRIDSNDPGRYYLNPADSLFRLLLMLAVKDRATAIRYRPWRGARTLSYVVDGREFDMVPPPRFLAGEIYRTVCEWCRRESRWQARWALRLRELADWWAQRRLSGDFWLRLRARDYHVRARIHPEPDAQGITFRLQPE